MNYKTLDDLNFSGKRVLLRADLNSEIVKGKPVMSPRISESAKTIKELLKKKAGVVVLAHQGQKGKEDFISLKGHAKLLKKFVSISFVDDVIGPKAVSAIKKLKPGESLLLDNVRFVGDELNPDPNSVMVKTLAPLFDIYINDAFSVSHRSQSSIVSFASLMENGVGRLMQRELESIENLTVNDALYILGGSKEENLKLIKPGRKILTCGVFGQLCKIASGFDFGAQNKFLAKEIETVVPKLREILKNVSVETPSDFAVRDAKGKRLDLKAEQFPAEFEIFDIGPETKKRYVEEIKKAKVILMKGTAGYCEEKQFQAGTKAILSTMANSKAFTVLGGGHTTTALQELRISEKKFDYISLSGGAFVSYLAGEKLPGLEVLKNKSR